MPISLFQHQENLRSKGPQSYETQIRKKVLSSWRALQIRRMEQGRVSRETRREKNREIQIFP